MFLSSLPPENKLIGRRLKNAFGVEETVGMRPQYWQHFDWLAEQGKDMEVWVRNTDIDRHRPEYNMKLEAELEVSMFIDEKRRFLAQLPCPLFINPDGYEGKFCKPYLYDRLASDNDPFERKLINVLGLEVRVKMLGKYWRYFDWLSERGDMETWVIQVDVHCRQKNLDLSDELAKSLRRHERKNHIEQKNIPLFICQSGYFDVDFRTVGKEGIPKDIEDSNGNIETIHLPPQFWRYSDWLERQGIDMVQWMKDVDVKRINSKRNFTFRSQIIIEMRADEKRRFLSDDEHCPFILMPDGY